VAGCFAKGSHRVISTTDCLIQRQENNEVMRQACRIASQLGIQPYDEITGQGVLRHVMARYALATGELMAVLVTAVEDFAGKEKLVLQLAQSVPGLRSIVQNINPAKTNVVLGPKSNTLWGASEIIEDLAGYRFRISAPSFFQVNPQQTVKLYSEAVRLASAGSEDEVLDLYCGAGTISLFLARHAKSVYGIELSKAAVEDAWQNAKMNAIENVGFSAGDVQVRLQKIASKISRPSIVVLDPPRAGCEPNVLKALIGLNLKRIVYVSCNPSTLARDAAILVNSGYAIGPVQPVDMFPHTSHVECVVAIERG
jgi:23S rRNA (uracil1939-C5)-methyltransferase